MSSNGPLGRTRWFVSVKVVSVLRDGVSCIPPPRSSGRTISPSSSSAPSARKVSIVRGPPATRPGESPNRRGLCTCGWRSSSWPSIYQRHGARRERACLDALELDFRREQTCTLSKRHRVNDEPILVDQVRVGERLGEARTAVDEDVLPRLLAQALDLLGEVAAHDGRGRALNGSRSQAAVAASRGSCRRTAGSPADVTPAVHAGTPPCSDRLECRSRCIGKASASGRVPSAAPPRPGTQGLSLAT